MKQMTCEVFQVRILTADDPAAVAREADVAAHVASCADCQTLIAKLDRLESAVRTLPEPIVAASASRVAFLERLNRSDVADALQSSESKKSARLGRWSAYRLLPRIAAAAAVLLLLLSGVWVLTGDVPSADASTEVVERLVEWNLNLAQASSAEERSEIFSSAVGPLKQTVAKARMLPEDQELAKMLLDNGQALANNQDPIDDVERLNDTADQLLKRIQVAMNRRNMRAIRIYSHNYALLRATAAGSHLQKLEPPPGENPQQFERLEKMISRDVELQKRLQKLLEQSPDATKQEILKALKLPQPQRRSTTRPTTRPLNRPTTRSSRPNRPDGREDRLPRPSRPASPHRPPLTPEQQKLEQQMRERRVREWFQDFKNPQKPTDTSTTAPSSGPAFGLHPEP